MFESKNLDSGLKAKDDIQDIINIYWVLIVSKAIFIFINSFWS